MSIRKKFIAKNTDSSSTDLFLRRIAYDLYAYEADPSMPSDAVIKDFKTYENLFYGRIDTSENIVLPNKEYFARLPSKSKKPFFAFDFVADAFKDLLKTATLRIQDGGLSLKNADDSEELYIGPYQIGRAYDNVGKNYNNHIRQIFDIFYQDYLIGRNKIADIENFEDFKDIFAQFARIGLFPSVPFNLSSYLISKYGSVLSTGLAVEIGELDHGDDEKKQNLFIDNRRFGIHKNLAAEYGFWVDKNAPWRLVANLGSSQMQEYIKKRYPEYSDLSSFFERYYTKASEMDIKLLRNNMIRLYNQVAIDKPMTRIPYEKNGCTYYKVIMRDTIQSRDEDFREPSYWLQIYIQFKSMETYLGYDENEVQKITRNALDLERTFDLERAMGYIDYKFRGFASTPNSSQFDQLTESLEAERKYDSSDVRDIIKLFGRSENTIIY